MASFVMKTTIVVLSALVLLTLRVEGQQTDPVADTGVARPVVAMAAFAPVGVTLASDATADTVRRRPKAIDVSESYELRLRIHRYAAYTVVPLFVVQSVAGNQLFQADKTGAAKPDWARNVHQAGAAALGTVFTINTVTGLWNLWESRDNDVGRTKRLLHSALLLASDAGFTYSGIALANGGRQKQASRTSHKNVAYYSMGAALAGYGIMLVGDH
jgi:hypothetical protein